MKNLVSTLCYCVVLWAPGCAPAPPPVAVTPPVKWKNSLGMSLVKLSGGTFRMGSRSETDAPIHDVTLSPFWIGQFEVTNAEFDPFWKRTRFPGSLANNQPAVRVSWANARKYCAWLSKKEGRRYRLPTEAEWEYAARGGLDQMEYPWGNQSVDGRAVFNQNTTNPVGSFPPNNFGLYDMVGNINECVSDWYGEDYYLNSPKLNPKGPPKPKPPMDFNVLRGGFYGLFEFSCARRQLWTWEAGPFAGIRIVLESTDSTLPTTGNAPIYAKN